MATALEREADAAAARGDYAVARAALLRASALDAGSFELWMKLAAMQRASGEPDAALASLDRALGLSPLNFTALLMRATLLKAQGGTARAGEAFGRALAQLPDGIPQGLEAVVAMARQTYADWQGDQAARLCDAARAVDALTPRLEAMIAASVRLASPDREGPTHYCFPGLPEIPFHPRGDFAWLAELEAATEAVAAEFTQVAEAQAAELVPYIQYPDSVPLDQWRALNRNRDWTAIHLIERGRVVEANARHCPVMMALLETLPQPHIPGAAPNAMFSLLAPNTHIPPHTGIANARLVCHLPLIVPEGCWFRVGSERRVWERGTAWVFDDTIEHEAMNSSSALRVILIVDVWHPALDDRDRAGIAAVMGAGGQVHGL